MDTTQRVVSEFVKNKAKLKASLLVSIANLQKQISAIDAELAKAKTDNIDVDNILKP